MSTPHAIRPTLSVVVPVYDSTATLDELVNRLREALAPRTDSYEIILVHDNGPQDCWPLIRTLASRHEQVRGIDLMKNYGQHNALLCGIRAARYELIATLDDDLQTPPEELPGLLDALTPEYDVVYGIPQQEQHGLFRNWASVLTKRWMARVLKAHVARDVSAFRVFRTRLRRFFEQFHSPDTNIDILLSWGTSRFTSVKVDHAERKHGRTGYTLGKLVKHAFNMMTGYSVAPLRLASLMGLLFGFIGFCLLVYTVAIYFLVGREVPGFYFLASVIVMFSGAQMLALGIIGEYLARIFYRVLDKPNYAVRQTTEEPVASAEPTDAVAVESQR